jgi:hypothetical protein
MTASHARIVFLILVWGFISLVVLFPDFPRALIEIVEAIFSIVVYGN